MRFVDALRHLSADGYRDVKPLSTMDVAVHAGYSVHVEEVALGDELDLHAGRKRCYLVNDDGVRQFAVRK